MGGEDKDKNITEASEYHSDVDGVIDNEMSKLLQDFNSTELFSVTSDESKGGNSCPGSDCDSVALTLKDLHLQRPVFTKPRKDIMCAVKKRTLLNIAVAASSYQRPIVWPARLANHTERINAHFLRPSRLKLSKKDAANTETKPSKSASLPKPALDGEASIEQGCYIFGSTSKTDYANLSFSRLSDQATECLTKDSMEKVCRCSCSETDSPERTICKHEKKPTSQSAELFRAAMEDSQASSCQKVFLNHRSPVCEFSYRPSGMLEQAPCTGQGAGYAAQSSSQATIIESASASVDQDVSLGLLEQGTGPSNSQDLVLEEANVTELASYFEDLLHIPRKMSTMAEMMYA